MKIVHLGRDYIKGFIYSRCGLCLYTESESDKWTKNENKISCKSCIRILWKGQKVLKRKLDTENECRKIADVIEA